MEDITRTQILPVEEDGQALADYALILSFIFAVCVIVVGALGLAIAGSFSSILPGF